MYPKHTIDPMYIRKPESFEEPRTIPKGWDISKILGSEEKEPVQTKAGAVREEGAGTQPASTPLP